LLHANKILTYLNIIGMTHKKPLTIAIPDPCNENWDKMPRSGNGRFCNNCQKTIIDFSYLSDQELLNYFSKPGAATCGRFHHDQLNRKIVPLKHKERGWSKFYKVAAATLAFLSLKAADASASRKKVNTTISPLAARTPVQFSTGRITIIGVVRDQHGHVVENAEVHFGDSLMCKTDKDGHFKFEIDIKDETQSTLIIFSYGRITTARNYHPAMMSTSYDVMLSPSSDGGSYGTIGVISRNVVIQSMPETIIEFKTSEKTLTTDARRSLGLLAEWMRGHPEIRVKLTTHAMNNNAVNPGKKFGQMVKKYLVDQEGITEDRLKTDLDVIPGIKQNILEVIGQGDED